MYSLKRNSSVNYNHMLKTVVYTFAVESYKK